MSLPPVAKRAGAENFDLCPEGMPGIEPRLTLLYSEGVGKGRISLQKLVELTAFAPAAHFGLAPKKGTLKPGGDADIVLFDPSVRWTMGKNTLHMASDYSAYEGVDVVGKAKGRGFAGVMKRHGFGGGPITHGQSDRQRSPGSIGSTSTPGRVFKGMRMAGRMGGHRVTSQNLEVVRVDAEHNLLAVKGSVPGHKGALVIVKEARKR